MKSIIKHLTVGLCLLLTFFSLGTILTVAQSQSSKETPNKLDSKQLWEIVREKRGDTPFTILTPEDLAGFSKQQIENFLLAGDPCDTAVPITYGQTVNGQLSNTDCHLPDNSYADFYMFNATQNDQITINLSSTAFDTYLGLANESGTFVIEDDDGGGGTNSRITVSLPFTGLYIILANSTFPNSFGNYTLSLVGGAPCTYMLTPTSVEAPASGGTFMFNVQTQSHCQWTVMPHYSYITSNSSGLGSGTATFTVAPNPTNFERFGSLGVGGQTFNVYQPGMSCQFSLNPTSVNISAAETTGTFSVIATEGCFWSMQTLGPFINATATGSGTANGFVTYTVSNNNGAARSGTIIAGNQTFTINQAGLNCTYSVTPTTINAPRQGMSGMINVETQAGCTWTASRTNDWITLGTTSGAGSGTIPFTIARQTGYFTRRASILVYTNVPGSTISVEQNGVYNNHKFDFTGDGKADLTTFRPSNGAWYIQTSDNQYQTYFWGLSTDVLAPADYDGDGKTDIAVFRPSNGVWYIKDYFGSTRFIQFGINGDIPVPADYDGDGFYDIAVYRPSTGVWYISKTSNSQTISTLFGLAEDIPTIGDYDGDGKSDIAVWRPSTGVWYRLNSSDNSFYAFQFGVNEDKPVAADFDGDGKTDIAVWRPSDRVWYRINSSNNSFYAEQFGLSEDLPVAADYDGDGKTDIAVWRPSTSIWYIQQSTAGFTAKQYGLSEDKPAQNSFVR